MILIFRGIGKLERKRFARKSVGRIDGKSYAELRNTRPITGAPLDRNFFLKLNESKFSISRNKYILKKKRLELKLFVVYWPLNPGRIVCNTLYDLYSYCDNPAGNYRHRLTTDARCFGFLKHWYTVITENTASRSITESRYFRVKTFNHFELRGRGMRYFCTMIMLSLTYVWSFFYGRYLPVRCHTCVLLLQSSVTLWAV